LRDVDLQRLLRSVRRLVGPERLNQAIAGNNSVRLEQEHCQQDALLLPSQVKRTPVGEDLERAEDPKLHRSTLALRRKALKRHGSSDSDVDHGVDRFRDLACPRGL
jgi:hypothetical protein